MKAIKQQQLKTGSKISLIVLLLAITWQFISAYRTSRQLISPLIPKSTVWEINEQIMFTAFVLTVSSIIALLFYFYNRYLVVIILVVLALIVTRFIYLPHSSY